MKVKDFTTLFEEKFPTHLAYKWDNVGLQIGSKESEITGILLSLDLTLEVVNEAIKNTCNLIVVHHPLIFSPIKKIDEDSYLGQMISMIIRNGITVYVAHTNFDLSNHGMNTILANMLGLEDQHIIEMETLEEGLGRFGTLPEPMKLRDFISKLKDLFELDSVKLITSLELDSEIETVAVSGGSGSTLLTNVNIENVDVYVTGDVTYHHALDARNNGLTVIDAGHNIEKFSLIELKKVLESNDQVPRIMVSVIDTNPYKNQ